MKYTWIRVMCIKNAISMLQLNTELNVKNRDCCALHNFMLMARPSVLLLSLALDLIFNQTVLGVVGFTARIYSGFIC